MSHYYISWLLQFPLHLGLLRINLIGWYVIWVRLSDLVPLWGYLVSANCSHLRGLGGRRMCWHGYSGRANEVSSWWDYGEVLMGKGTRAERVKRRERKKEIQQAREKLELTLIIRKENLIILCVCVCDGLLWRWPFPVCSCALVWLYWCRWTAVFSKWM